MDPLGNRNGSTFGPASGSINGTAGQGDTGPQQTGIRDVDALQVPDRLLLDHRARVLDPVTALRVRGDDRQLRPTAYVADTLLVPSGTWAVNGLRSALSTAAELTGLEIVEPAEPLTKLSGTHAEYAVPVRLRPKGDVPTEVDAWRVLAALRNSEGLTETETRGIGLNHLLAGGWPMMSGGAVPGGGNWPALPSGPLTEYGRAGSGGRTPVAYVGAPPRRNPELATRRPVVAILDTGIGPHPWWDTDPTIVTRSVQLDGIEAGHVDPLTDPETRGDLLGPLDGVLDSHAGHGTFIAGLVHQLCPDANLLAIRVMSSDGIVLEDELIWALTVLHERLVRTRAGQIDDGHLDVVVLSLGYYHEALMDPAADAPILASLLRALGELGVIVVCAAGNDATMRPMYPAAFTPYPGGLNPGVDEGVVPVVSVGSRNPDASIALFSNDGAWVSAWDIGAALISTFPTSFDGGGQPSTAVRNGATGLLRRTIDPDRYSSDDPDVYPGGFGTWSGTSFAAPVLAGRLAQELIDGPNRDPAIPTLDDGDQAAAVRRGWAAVRARTRLVPPSTVSS